MIAAGSTEGPGFGPGGCPQDLDAQKDATSWLGAQKRGQCIERVHEDNLNEENLPLVAVPSVKMCKEPPDFHGGLGIFPLGCLFSVSKPLSLVNITQCHLVGDQEG